jgi:hypothetical protein
MHSSRHPQILSARQRPAPVAWWACAH